MSDLEGDALGRDAIRARDCIVLGHCPMGCGETLYLGTDARITCDFAGCPDSSAVAKILDDPETEHVVVLEEDTFNLKHPLRERVDDELLECEVGKWLNSLDEPPAPLGRYRVVRHQPDAYSESYRGDDGPFDLVQVT